MKLAQQHINLALGDPEFKVERSASLYCVRRQGSQGLGRALDLERMKRGKCSVRAREHAP